MDIESIGIGAVATLWSLKITAFEKDYHNVVLQQIVIGFKKKKPCNLMKNKIKKKKKKVCFPKQIELNLHYFQSIWFLHRVIFFFFLSFSRKRKSICLVSFFYINIIVAKHYCCYEQSERKKTRTQKTKVSD